jgi:hypothetical protein
MFLQTHQICPVIEQAYLFMPQIKALPGEKEEYSLPPL